LIEQRRAIRPEQFGHRVEFGEPLFVGGRQAPIQCELLPARGQQAATQRALEQVKAEQRFVRRGIASARAGGCPARLDLADAFDHHRVVIAVRASVQWQTKQPRARILGWKEQAISAKIVKSDPAAADRTEQTGETAIGHELAGQQVVALHARIVSGRIEAIDRAKWQGTASEPMVLS
jgi:hypothetical protein